MNKELFRSMQRQMQPGESARAALTEKLTTTKKKTAPVGRYVAIAACATVIVAAVPVYGMVRDYLKWQVIEDSFLPSIVRRENPHSYTIGTFPTEDNSAPESNAVTGAEGDYDMGMTPGELTDNMLEAGFTQEDVDGYLSSGWQMTWANWWKFYHMCEETGEWTLNALLDFSRVEGLAINTGDADIPGGAYICDAPDQSEAVTAYQNLMARFEADYGLDRYPEWYGGAYIDEYGGLIVNIVAYYEEHMEDKTLYLQIQDWAGSSRISFRSSSLSLNQLRELQDKTITAMEELGMQYGCGVNEESGQVELTLYRYSEEALWKLAVLDPADTAIVVLIDGMSDTLPTEEPALIAPSVSQSVQPDEEYVDPRTPVSNLPGVIVDEDGVIAYEPVLETEPFPG